MASIGQGLVWLFRTSAVVPPPVWLDGLCTAAAIVGIRGYRLFLSRISGRRCMFRQGCSSHALEQLHVHGWTSGRSAIVDRLDQCNGHYVMSFDGQRYLMTTSDGHKHDESQISPWLLAKYQDDHAELIQKLTTRQV